MGIVGVFCWSYEGWVRNKEVERRMRDVGGVGGGIMRVKVCGYEGLGFTGGLLRVF